MRSSLQLTTHTCSRKLGCQLQLNMEYQTRALAAVTGKDAASHLRLPWTVGVLMDNDGVTFVYLTVPRDGKRTLLQLDKLFWTEQLHAIIRCLHVIKVRPSCLRAALMPAPQDYGDLFWDMILRAAGHSAAPMCSASTQLAAKMAEERVKLSSTAVGDTAMSDALLDVYFQLLAARTGLPYRWHVSQLSDLLPAASRTKRALANVIPLQRLHVRLHCVSVLTSGRSAYFSLAGAAVLFV